MNTPRPAVDKRAIIASLERGALTADEARALLAVLEGAAEFKRGRPAESASGTGGTKAPGAAPDASTKPLYLELVAEVLRRHASGDPMSKSNQMAIAGYLRGDRGAVRVRVLLERARLRQVRALFVVHELREILREVRGLPAGEDMVKQLAGAGGEGPWKGTNLTHAERTRCLAILKERWPGLFTEWTKLTRAFAAESRRKAAIVDREVDVAAEYVKRAKPAGGADLIAWLHQATFRDVVRVVTKSPSQKEALRKSLTKKPPKS